MGVPRVQFPPTVGRRGRPKTGKKTAIGWRKDRHAMCVPFGQKSLAERRAVMLHKIVEDVRVEDVSEEHPIDDACLQVDRQPLPSVLFNTDVNLSEIKTLMSGKAWRRLQQAVQAQLAADKWFCGCCMKDVGSS